MAEGSNHRVTVSTNSAYNRANRIESLRNSIPLGELIKFPVAMTPAQLQAIPKATITTDQAALLNQCAVCFHPFTTNEDEVRKLPCNHLYHEQCIFPWLQSNPSCPICRLSLVGQDDENFEDVIRHHYDMLTRDLMRRLAEHAAVSDSESDSDQELSVSVVEEEASPGDSHGDREPRRAAALRADSAIRQMYRSHRTVDSTRRTRK